MKSKVTAKNSESSTEDKILLVDDNPTNLQVLYQTLDAQGYNLLIAKSGQAALDIAKKAKPSLILLDIMMPPGIDGYETCRLLKEDPATERAAVIFMSALDETKDKVRGLEMGAVDYIAKPFQGDEVLARVKTHLTVQRLERNLSKRNQQLETANQKMKRDLEAAARVQKSLLPDSSPFTDRARFSWRYQPCDELGGDALNVFKLDEEHIAMYVLDVSGHGVPASLLSVSVTRNFSNNLHHSTLLLDPAPGGEGFVPASPAKVAGQLNELYPMDFDNLLYFTLLYGILNLKTHEFTFVSAGHPGPIHLQSNGNVKVIDAPATPIGMIEDPEYQDTVLKLAPGDRLFIYTDGMYEEKNAKHEEFSRDRLKAAILEDQKKTLAESVDSLFEKVVAWHGGDSFTDDVSVLAAEIGGAK